jgi:2-succinyl-6-hydroxy-2,4-cyclohexadiene-1-carboxylate synthase
VAEDLVLLHGFSGTHRAWDGVLAHLDGERYRALALDLPGHGELADAPRPLTFEGCVESVLARAPESFALCGYSLGGRVALHVALAAPAQVRRLVLVSCSPGIENADERVARKRSDRELADELESIPFEDFIERWRAQPLFAGEPPEAGRLARADQRRNRPDALAAALRGIGAGEMGPLWDRLGELAMPLVVIAGERDAKYRAIGARMVEMAANAQLVLVPGGHGLPLESPAQLARAICSGSQSGSTPRPGPSGRAIVPSTTGSGSSMPSNSPSVASPQGGIEPREASAAAVWSAAATPSGPS